MAAVTQPAYRHSRETHIHIAGLACPICEQPVPDEKAEEFRSRLETRDRKLADDALARARIEFSTEKAQLEAAGRQALEQARREGADALAAERAQNAAAVAEARDQAKKESDVAAAGRIAALEDRLRESEASWKGKIDEAGRDRDAALARLKDLTEEQDRIVACRIEESLAALEKDHFEKQGEKDAAHAAETQKLIATITFLEEQGRERETGWREKIEQAIREREAVVAQAETLRADQEQAIARRVQEARDALEKDHTQKQNEKDAAHAAETQKLTSKVADLARQLEKRTAEELGEGAEVQLFDDLKAEFEPDGDRIERIGRGNPGADIRHTVIHNGQECGVILYDSKNHMAWRDEFVAKLVTDRTAAKADHAILCARKFPRDQKQLAERDGVLIVNPARAVTLVGILRRHMIQIHTLRLSRAERTKKMAALYDFITSEQFANLLNRIETHAETLLDIQAKEIKAHEKIWRDQGTHLKSILKVLRGELLREVEAIIGADVVRTRETAE
ncbi:MAG: DUF2130 domain-containing protein [Bauldia sp.]|nr:DUF2130 domain-containing protein [Bauldia sp.]